MSNNSKKADKTLEALQEWWDKVKDPNAYYGYCMHGRIPFSRCDFCGELDDNTVKQLFELSKTLCIGCGRVKDDPKSCPNCLIKY